MTTSSQMLRMPGPVSSDPQRGGSAGSTEPVPARIAFSGIDRPKIFAHRGSSGLFPEHTRAAYLRALEDGADGIEVDVHLTRDRQVVCFHDATVERTSDGEGAVAELTLEQMRVLDVQSWKAPQLPVVYGRPEDQLMTLAETLELLREAGREVSLAIELKHPSPFGHELEDKVLTALLDAGWDPETSTIPVRSADGDEAFRIEVSFMSFHAGSLLHLGQLIPPEHLCALFSTVTMGTVRSRLQHLRFSATLTRLIAPVLRGSARDAAAMVWNGQVGLAGPGVRYVREHRAEVRAWIARGMQLRVWTVDDPADVALLGELGVQQVTTNYPARVRELVSTGR